MAGRHVTCPRPGNIRFIYSRLATSLRSLVIILPSLTFILLYNVDIHVCNRIYRYTFLRGHTGAYAFTLSSLVQFQIRFAYWISWISPFWRIMTRNLRARYHSDLRALIASAKCIDLSSQLRLTVTETISFGFQRPIGQRRVATPTNEKSYGLEIYELQIQKRHELSTQSRLTVEQTIRVDTGGQPARRHVCDSQSNSIATNSSYENSMAINRRINNIR